MNIPFQEICHTEKNGPCVFPFKRTSMITRETKAYHACTMDGRSGCGFLGLFKCKKPWCAFKVDKNGYAIRNKWDSCVGGKACERRECFRRYKYKSMVPL